MHTRILAALVVLLAAAAPASAQMWDSPTFFAPRPGEDLGIYLVDTDGFSDVGFMGIWRQQGNLNLGLRAGIAGDNVMVGSEFFGDLNGPGGTAPLVMAWNLGVGATFADNVTIARVPLGVSIGLALGSGNVRIMPYVHPRIAADLIAIDGAGDNDDTDLEFNVPVDLGADVQLGQSLVLRLGATFGDNDAVGVGLAYRFGRRLVVR